MPEIAISHPSSESMQKLSRLLLAPDDECLHSEFGRISREEFDDLLVLANTNHVVIRGMEVFLRIALGAQNEMRTRWAIDALAAEKARIENAILFLHAVCEAFVEHDYDVTVIKSLDHWPDLGSDLDLYTNASPERVCRMMQSRFRTAMAPRSWGDRLARKWNFLIPGLSEAVEVHMGRLGQTGEQTTIALHIVPRARTVEVGDLSFRVPSVSDRLIISTLQRMYRHFYFRLCDVIDSATLVETGSIDYEDLHRSATIAGIWEGLATYLVIVSDYVKRYRGVGLNLPELVRTTARFGGDQVYYSRSFIRVPIIPHSVSLYSSQLTGLLRKRELESSARLGLLPWLATAAVVGQRITGSDKGIW